MILANGFIYFTATAQVLESESKTTVRALVEFTAHSLSEEDVQSLDSEYQFSNQPVEWAIVYEVIKYA